MKKLRKVSTEMIQEVLHICVYRRLSSFLEGRWKVGGGLHENECKHSSRVVV